RPHCLRAPTDRPRGRRPIARGRRARAALARAANEPARRTHEMMLATRAATTTRRCAPTRDATTPATRSRLGLSRVGGAGAKARATRDAKARGAFYENPNEIAYVNGVNEAQREIYDAVNASGAPGARTRRRTRTRWRASTSRRTARRGERRTRTWWCGRCERRTSARRRAS
ncbi:hypothetical protein N9D08_01025, partial [bacterium]|nr:hypothetical protein [bacterium]